MGGLLQMGSVGEQLIQHRITPEMMSQPDWLTTSEADGGKEPRKASNQIAVLIDLASSSRIGRALIAVGTALSGRIKQEMRSKLESEIQIARSGETVIRLDQGTDPPDWEFEIPIDNRSSDELEIVGLDLRFGRKRWRRQFGDLFWNKNAGVRDPRFLDTHVISPNSKDKINLYHTPPAWVYNAKKPFTIRIVGAILLSTSFGQIKLSVRTGARVTDEMVERDFPQAAEDFNRLFGRTTKTV